MASKLMPAAAFPRHLNRCREQAKADQLYNELRDKIVEAKSGGSARQIILSSEILFRPPTASYALAFRDSVIDLLGDSFQIVAYLRAPSSAYLALLQQKLKGSCKLRPAQPPHYKKVLKAYIDLFGRERISLRVFDRVSLFEGDIVKDFCHSYLADHPQLVDQLVPAGEANVSLSAESMAVCLLFRKHFYGMKENKHSKLSRKVVSGLRDADTLIQAERPALLPSIQACIDSAAAPQLKWLRKQWGIEFKNYNDALLDSELSADQSELLDQANSLEKIVCLDLERVKDLAHLLATQTKVAEVSKVTKWCDKLAAASQAEILSQLNA